MDRETDFIFFLVYGFSARILGYGFSISISGLKVGCDK